MLNSFNSELSTKLAQIIETAQSFKGRKVAVFDADGTLWQGDLGEAFFRHQLALNTPLKIPFSNPWDTYFQEANFGDTRKAFGWLAQWNEGMAEIDLIKSCDDFYLKHWRHLVFKPVASFISQLLQNGFEVWVITGSLTWSVQAGAADLGINRNRVLGSAVKVQQGILTASIERKIPYRETKKQLIEEVIKVQPLFAAGNTYWDKEMLETAQLGALAICSEKPGEVNYEAEQKLQNLAQTRNWLRHSFML